MKKGLILEGNNLVLTRVSIYFTKNFYGKDLTFAQQYELFSEYRNSIIKSYSAKYKTPMIFITTEGREDVKTKEYYNSIVDVVNCDSQYRLSASGGVKVRGNSTADDRWSPNNKPYRIKFEKKYNRVSSASNKNIINFYRENFREFRV